MAKRNDALQPSWEWFSCLCYKLLYTIHTHSLVFQNSKCDFFFNTQNTTLSSSYDIERNDGLLDKHSLWKLIIIIICEQKKNERNILTEVEPIYYFIIICQLKGDQMKKRCPLGSNEEIWFWQKRLFERFRGLFL
jgi:hypothetical protein